MAGLRSLFCSITISGTSETCSTGTDTVLLTESRYQQTGNFFCSKPLCMNLPAKLKTNLPERTPCGNIHHTEQVLKRQWYDVSLLKNPIGKNF